MRTEFPLIGLFMSCAYALSPLVPFSFSKQGNAVNVPGNKNKECDDAASFLDDAPGIALALDIYQNKCWSDGRYNSLDFSIQPGMVGSFRAYQVSGPAKAPQKFRGSKNTIWLSFDKAGSYKVYLLNEVGSLTEKGTVTAPKVDTFVKIPLLADTPITLVVAPASSRLSTWPLLAAGVEGATLWQDSQFKITARRWDVSVGQPYNPSTSFQVGPDSWNYRYSSRKQFFAVINGDKEGVVWQDETTRKIFLSWMTADLLSISNIELPTENVPNPVLEAAAGNGKGEVAYIVVANDCARKVDAKCDLVTPNICVGIKVNSGGKKIVAVTYDTTNKGLNIYQSHQSGASLVWNTDDNTLGLVISRRMVKGGDGLNHQGAIAVVLNGQDMSVIKNWGQTSGHSFGNSLHVGQNGKFVGADMGDNYPRGINLFDFTQNSRKQSKVVYTFKTKHCSGDVPNCYGITTKYEEISTSAKTFYAQSNDNEVYTELAHSGAVEVDDDALLVLFSGEKPSLDNGMALKSHNAARNIGFVKVPRDMANTNVLSTGPTEKGGFYDFGGRWRDQENKGVNWLTSFTSIDENASRLKAAKLSKGQIMVLYETWTGKKYVSSNLMTIDKDGKITRTPRAVEYPFRMPFADEITSTDSNTVVFYAGVKGKLVRYEVSLDPSLSNPVTTTKVSDTTKTADGDSTTTKAADTTTATKAPNGQDGCVDAVGWKAGEKTCATYKDEKWCENGSPGPKWQSDFTWDKGKDGMTAQQACCVCGSSGPPTATDGVVQAGFLASVVGLCAGLQALL